MSHASASLIKLVDYCLGQEFDSLDENTLHALKTFILDSLGVGICGARVPFASPLKQLVASWGEGRQAQVMNTGEWLPAPSAAMVNAWQIHNQEFDCVHEDAVVHPMAVIQAVLLAFSQRQGTITGQQFLTAVCVAVDAATTIGSASNAPVTFFRPAWCGAMGAVLGMAWLAKMERGQALQALGIVYSMLGGTMQAHVEGTAMLAMQIGIAARSAVNAFDLAMAGLDGPVDVLEGPFGFFSLIERESDFPSALEKLFTQHQINQVSHKPFPTGRACHGGLDALQVLIEQHGLQAVDISKITLFAPPLINRLIGRLPQRAMAVSYARLCFAYSGATLFIDGDVAVDCYDPDKLTNSERLALADKFVVVVNDIADPNAMNPQRIKVELTDGRTLCRDIPATLGSPARPLTQQQHLAKFRRCCQAAPNPLSESQIQQIIDMTDALENVENVEQLIKISLPGAAPVEKK